MAITVLKQLVTEQSSTALHEVGEYYVDYHATLGRRKFIYLQADGAKSLGDACVIGEGVKAQECAANTRHLPPCVPLLAVTDAYYAWFQCEGEVANCRAMISTSLGTGLDYSAQLALYAATHVFVPCSSGSAAVIGFAFARGSHPYQATSYTCATLSVKLLGGMGAPFVIP